MPNVNSKLNNSEEKDTMEPNENNSVELRTGPTRADYRSELNDRLAIFPDHSGDTFTEPEHLERIMAVMEAAQVPISIWRMFINIAKRVVALCRNHFNAENLRTVVIYVIPIIADFFIENRVLAAFMQLLAIIGPELGPIIWHCYNIIVSLGINLWEFLSRKLEEMYKFFAGQFGSFDSKAICQKRD